MATLSAEPSRPAAGRSAGRTFSRTLPNRSTSSTSARISPVRMSASGSVSVTSSSVFSSGPRSSSGRPAARCAAAGANTSRPWNTLRHRVKQYVGGGDLERAGRAARRLPRQREQSVVGPDQDPTRRRLDRDRLAIGPHAGVDHTQQHAVLRRERDALAERHRARLDVRGRHAVGEIDHDRVRGDGGDHAVAHADELVADPEVREEQDRSGHARSFRRSTRNVRRNLPVVQPGAVRARRICGGGAVS